MEKAGTGGVMSSDSDLITLVIPSLEDENVGLASFLCEEGKRLDENRGN